MATNEILQFAETNTGTNLLTQAEYAADAQRSTGNQPGVARSKLVNKALRQATLLAAGLAEFIADNQANNVTDSLTPQDISDYLTSVIRSFGMPTAVATGTANALAADFTPDVALAAGLTVLVRAATANTTTAVTLAANGGAAKTIVKGNNVALAVGDIAGGGHWLEMTYDTTFGKWVLMNPAKGVTVGSYQPLDATLTALAALVTAADKLIYATGIDTFALTPLTAFARSLLAGTSAADAMTILGLRTELNAGGSAPMYTCRAWVNFNGTGTLAIRSSGNVSSVTDNGVGDYTVNFSTPMPDAAYSVCGISRRADSDSNSVLVLKFGGVFSAAAVQILTKQTSAAMTVNDADVVCVNVIR